MTFESILTLWHFIRGCLFLCGILSCGILSVHLRGHRGLVSVSKDVYRIGLYDEHELYKVLARPILSVSLMALALSAKVYILELSYEAFCCIFS